MTTITVEITVWDATLGGGDNTPREEAVVRMVERDPRVVSVKRIDR